MPTSQSAIFTSEELADAFAAALPPALRPRADELADLLTGAAAGEPVRATPALREALAALAGREIDLTRGTVAFGEGNQFGDVTIGDVVSGDKLTVQVAVSQARGLRVMLGIAALTLVVSVAAVAAILWPSLADPGPMSGLFNVAVAEFGQVDAGGTVTAWRDGARLSRSIAERLEHEFAAAPGLGGVVQVRHERVGVIAGRTPRERAEQARRRAAELGAHVLIYGNLDRSGDVARFVPQFYISEEAFANAAELVGDERLGLPVPLAGARGLGAELQVSDALKARTQALTLFAVGLAYYVGNDMDRARALFEEATAVEDWREPAGKEVMYLFLGSAYRLGTDPEGLDKARAAYEQVIRLNPDYARGYIGMGHVRYEEFVRDGAKSPALLNQAIAWYERASTAKVQPAQAYADVKIMISLANAYTIRGQLGGPGDFDAAAHAYKLVTEAYERGGEDLAAFASQAYFGQGVIAERRDRDTYRALELYRRARDLAAGDTALRSQAETKIASLEPALARP